MLLSSVSHLPSDGEVALKLIGQIAQDRLLSWLRYTQGLGDSGDLSWKIGMGEGGNLLLTSCALISRVLGYSFKLDLS